MAASSEIRFKIGADTSAFSKSMIGLQTVAEGAGKAIERKLGMKDAFKAGVLALGLNIEKLKDSLAEMFTGGSQEAWKSALESATEASRIIEENTLKRMSTLRQIAELEKTIQRNAGNEDPTPQKAEANPVKKALDAIGEKAFGAGAAFFNKIGAKGAAGAFGRTSEMFGKRSEEGVETEAEVRQRVAKAEAERLTREGKVAELTEKQQKNQERIADAKRELTRIGADDEGKQAAAMEDINIAEDRLAEAKRKGADTDELELTLLAKIKALREITADAEKKADEAHDKAVKDEVADRQRTTQELQKQEGLIDAVTKAQKSLTDAKHDVVAFSLSDAASGKRGNASDRARARSILRDEATARRLFDSGNSVTQFENGRNVSRGAQFFQDRAEQMRNGFGKLNSSDRDPFAAATAQLVESNSHLRNIEGALTTSVDTSKGSGKSPAPKSFAGK